MFGKAHRKYWRNNVSYNNSQKVSRETDDHTGSGTPTYQLYSNQPGLVAHPSGKLTSARVSGATVFVNHCTNYIYAHLMNYLSGDETLEEKHGYEILVSTNGYTVKRYYTDNVRFRTEISRIVVQIMVMKSLSVEYVVIIRMGSQKAISRNSFWNL